MIFQCDSNLWGNIFDNDLFKFIYKRIKQLLPTTFKVLPNCCTNSTVQSYRGKLFKECIIFSSYSIVDTGVYIYFVLFSFVSYENSVFYCKTANQLTEKYIRDCYSSLYLKIRLARRLPFYRIFKLFILKAFRDCPPAGARTF